MRRFGRITAILCLILACLLGFFGVMALPSGGLMFALPFIFFLPAVIFALIGLLLLVITRKTHDTSGKKDQAALKTDSQA